MSDKIKNGVIIVLVCIIAILVCFLIFVLGMKFANKENELIIKQDSEVKVEETKISYVEENDNVPYITLACFEVQNNEIKDFYNTNYQKI